MMNKSILSRLTAWILALIMAAMALPLSSAESTPDWKEAEGWEISKTENGVSLTTSGSDSVIEYSPVKLPADWRIDVDFTIVKGDVRVVFAKADNKPQFAFGATVKNGKARLYAWKWKDDRWQAVTQAAGSVRFDIQTPLTLTAQCYHDDDFVRIILSQNDRKISEMRTSDATQRMLAMTKALGLSASGETAFSHFRFSEIQKEETPMEMILKNISPGSDGFYQAIARQAVDDVIGNFWIGDHDTGHVLPTWSGFSENLSDSRGVIWESAMLLYGFYDIWTVTQDPYYFKLLEAQATWFRLNYRETELEKAGGLFNWASDDCAWNALLMLEFYSVTGDQWFIDRTIGLLDSANERWYDEKLNGLLYKDGVDFMSLYETGIAWSWLRLWEITGEQRFYDLALRSYEGMHDKLGANRDDGLYYVEATYAWPRGGREDIHEAASSSFLTGNMCMAALAAKFYRITGEQEYLDRVYKTNEGILRYYDIGGVLLDDRDAWTNGAFVAFYVSEVLSLPNTEVMQALIKSTALSIVTNDRTQDGYYGGSWQGPAKGNSVWYAGGSVPEQSMTTGTAVLMVTAAALLEEGTTEYNR